MAKKNNVKPKVAIDRKFFYEVAVEARITKHAADVMYDRFREAMKEAYMESTTISIPGFGVISSTEPEQVLGWNVYNQRIDYIVRMDRERVKIYPKLRELKKCKARK